MFKNIFSHRLMLADRVRMASYQKAIQKVVKKGDLVCDIGTGSGVLAFFSLSAGARKVYAIEVGEIIEESKRLAQMNGLAERIVFIKDRSDTVELPEKVDVVISELLGVFGLEENLPRFQLDARKRFLKPGGKLIPSWLELYLVPVETDLLWDDYIGLWNKDFYGLNFQPVRDCAISLRYVQDCSGKVRFLAAPSITSHFNFYEQEVPSILRGELAINREGIFHGLVGYFKVGLSENVILSTSPEKPLTHWQHNFFPIQEAVNVKNGDIVRYKIKVIHQGYSVFWQWEIKVYRGKDEIASFDQSDFGLEKEELIIGRKDFKPKLTKEAEIYRRIFNLCDGNRTVEEISKIILAEHPEKYRTIKDAAEKVVAIARGNVTI